jgi:hypothetical protein
MLDWSRSLAPPDILPAQIHVSVEAFIEHHLFKRVNSGIGYTHSTLHREGALSMIQKSQIVPLILARCPGFQPIWEKHLELWEGEEAGIFNDFAEFATFIVNAYANQETETVVAAFGLIEELLNDDDEEIRAAASIGFLEAVRNSASWRPFGAAVFAQWFGPKTKEAWAEIEETWRGKRSLADVVRAEQAAATNKTKF